MNALPVTVVKPTAPGLSERPAARAVAAAFEPAARRAEAPPPPAPAVEVDDAARSARQTAEAVEAANRRLQEKGSELTIEFEDSLDRMVFRLIDRETREVVRQIPSEQALAVARALAADDTSGVLVRANA